MAPCRMLALAKEAPEPVRETTMLARAQVLVKIRALAKIRVKEDRVRTMKMMEMTHRASSVCCSPVFYLLSGVGLYCSERRLRALRANRDLVVARSYRCVEASITPELDLRAFGLDGHSVYFVNILLTAARAREWSL